MSTAARLRRFINSLNDGKMFTITEILDCGKRKTIDVALSRLASKGVIQRLACGVYMKGDEYTKRPQPIEVAEVKANAFGKTLSLNRNDLNKSLNPSVTSDNIETIEFWIDGYSSSFQYGKTKVILQSANCKKKSKKPRP